MEINKSLPEPGAFSAKSLRFSKSTLPKEKQSLAKGILKFINYTKEAFMLPAHLIGLGLATAFTAAAMIALPVFFNIDASGLLFILGGLELTYLGSVLRSKRFISAVNAKYSEELDEFYSLKEVVEIYNNLTGHAQRRFEDYRNMLTKIKENFSNLNSSFPDIVRQYLKRMDQLQLSYIRLLAIEDKSAAVVGIGESPQTWVAQIEGIRKSMTDDSERVRRLKEGRIQTLQKRIANYNKKIEKRKELSVQLHSIEEMIKFFHDSPISREESLQSSQAVQDLVDDTSELHSTLAELDQAMLTEIESLDKSDQQYSSSIDDIRI